jgi:pimeloyl-ACP methyl ester carboxylesterase
VTTLLVHGKAQLALHELRPAPDNTGAQLLLLHGLGERSPSQPPAMLDGWPGAVYALDFTGHGASTLPKGGGYTAEMLMADADAALARLGRSTVLGRGLGAYIALLVAGARPELVAGAILADGPGLIGGGIRPGSPFVVTIERAETGPPDPFALAELSRDVRPPDYATTYVRQAVELSELEHPISVTTVVRPEWIEAVVAEPGVLDCSLGEALARYAAIAY